MSPFSFTSVCPSLSSYHPVVDAIAVIVPLSSCVDLPLYIFISPLLALTFSPQSVGMWAHNSACVCFRGGAFSLLLCFSCLHTWKQLGNHSPAFNLMITHYLRQKIFLSQIVAATVVVKLSSSCSVGVSVRKSVFPLCKCLLPWPTCEEKSMLEKETCGEKSVGKANCGETHPRSIFFQKWTLFIQKKTLFLVFCVCV